MISYEEPDSMIERIGHITILVKDHDEAVRFYTENLVL